MGQSSDDDFQRPLLGGLNGFSAQTTFSGITLEQMKKRVMQEVERSKSLEEVVEAPTLHLPAVRNSDPVTPVDFAEQEVEGFGVTDPRVESSVIWKLWRSDRDSYYANQNPALTGIGLVLYAIGRHWRLYNKLPTYVYVSASLAPLLVSDAEVFYGGIYSNQIFWALGGDRVHPVPVFFVTALAANAVYCQD